MVCLALLGLMLSGTIAIGDPAPPLEPMMFLKGEAVRQWTPGTVYVLEFSGSQCVPCAQFIPRLTALQTRHRDLVVVPIYGEPAEQARKYLAANGEKMGYRVAVDPDQTIQQRWVVGHGFGGIPYAVVVDKAGKIAWAGNPEADGLVEAVPSILAGTFDPRFDGVKMRFNAAVRLRLEAYHQRQARSEELFNAINELLMTRRWGDAVAASEAATRDLPEFAERFAGGKLFALAADPATADQAVAFAVEYAVGVATSREANPTIRLLNLTKTLLGAAEVREDKALLDLTVGVAERAADLAARDRDGGAQLRSTCLYFRSEALARLGKSAEAAAGMREVLELAAKRTPSPGQDADQFRSQPTAFEAKVRSRLGEIEGAAGK